MMNAPLLQRLDIAPEQLPGVNPSELVQAWKAATIGAEAGMVLQPGDIEGVEFRWPEGQARFVFADLDAASWAAALDRLYGLDNLRGLAILFRLLALIDVMARAKWLRPLFRLGQDDGVTVDPDLLRVASAQPLTASARFEAEALRKALGDRVAQPALATAPRRLGRL